MKSKSIKGILGLFYSGLEPFDPESSCLRKGCSSKLIVMLFSIPLVLKAPIDHIPLSMPY